MRFEFNIQNQNSTQKLNFIELLNSITIQLKKVPFLSFATLNSYKYGEYGIMSCYISIDCSCLADYKYATGYRRSKLTESAKKRQEKVKI